MKKNIVILGGGFGGISAALTFLKKFRKEEYKNFDIILIDKNNFHLFTPLLYEAAAVSKGILNILEDLLPMIAIPFDKIFSKYIKKQKIKIVKKEVKKLDIKGKKIIFKDESYFLYDYLVLSSGMEANFFDITNFSLNPLFTLKTLDDALKIRENLLKLEPRDSAKIVVGGGGPTGVELAAEIKNQFKHFEVIIINATSRILNNFHPRISQIAEERLLKIGIKIISNEVINEVREKSIVLQSGKAVKYDLFICALGIKPSKIVNDLSFPKDRSGRIQINDFLKTDSIFAIGDVASLNDKTPPLAHFAIEEGKKLAKNIVREIRGQNPKKYIPKNYPYIVPLGGKYAVSRIGSFVIKGYFAWIFKGLVELNYFLMILSLIDAFRIWLKGFILFMKYKDLG